MKANVNGLPVGFPVEADALRDSLSEKQFEALRAAGPELFRLFVLGDPDVLEAKCGCCREKRAFAEKLVAELQLLK